MIKNDIFISYSTNTTGENQKWIKEFSSVFKILLDKKLKQNTKLITSNNLLVDKEYSSIAPVDVFSETKVFIIILTKEHQNSSKAKQELATIKSVINDGEGRLFKILISDIPLTEQLITLQVLVPYIFYKKENNLDSPIIFSDVIKYQSLKRYWLRLADLVFNITSLFNKDDEFLMAKETVFLAETGLDQYVNREIIKRELIHYGYNILPNETILSKSENIEEYISNCIKKSDLSVHIISSSEGYVVNNNSSVYYQNSLASKYSKNNTNFKRLLWISPDIVFENEEQRIKIEKLKRDSDALIGAELVQIEIEEFKSLMLRSLVKISERDLESENSSKKSSVYIINDNKNNLVAQKISEVLVSEGIDTISQKNTNNKKELLTNHKRNLVICNGVVVCVDSENDSWVNSKMKDIVKSAGFGRKAQIKAKAIVLTDKKEAKKVKYNDFDIIDDVNNISSKSIKVFIEKLKR